MSLVNMITFPTQFVKLISDDADLKTWTYISGFMFCMWVEIMIKFTGYIKTMQKIRWTLKYRNCENEISFKTDASIGKKVAIVSNFCHSVYRCSKSIEINSQFKMVLSRVAHFLYRFWFLRSFLNNKKSVSLICFSTKLRREFDSIIKLNINLQSKILRKECSI